MIYFAIGLFIGIIIGGASMFLSIRREWRRQNKILSDKIISIKTKLNAARNMPHTYEISDDQLKRFFNGESIENNYFDPF